MKHGQSAKDVREACMIVLFVPIGTVRFFTNDRN